MGNFNCKGKLSKESKNQMRGEAYRPSKPDTQGKETIHVEGKPVIKNDDNEDTVVINAKIPFVNPETPTKSESVMQGPNTSLSDMNGLKASGSTGKQDRKQHESDAIPEKPVEKTSKDVLSSVIIKNNSGEETNLKKAPPTGISLNKVPDYKSDDAEIEKPGYLFSKGFKGEEAQPEDSGFTDKITGIKVPLPTDQSRSSHDTAPTEKAKDEDKNLTKVDENVPTKTTSGNVSEPTVEIKSNQSNGLKDDSTEKPSDKLQHGNTPSDKLQPGNTPSDKLQPGNTPSDKLQPGSTPSDKLQPENAPSDKLQPGNTPSDKLQPGNTPSDKLRPGNTPSDKLQPENAPSDKLQPGNTPSDKLQPENAPSDKLQPENAPSDNQQNNSDSTGYNHSEFSNPCDEQDKKMSKEMKEIDGKKKKKKEKKPDKYDPLPTANIQNYYGHVGVVNIGNDVVNIVQKKKKKVEKGDNIVQKEKEVEKVPITETFQDTVTISQREMKVLVKVSESVGMFYGPRSTGTCWRVGKDKVLTAAHVVKDNIWSNFHEFLNEEKYKDCYVDFDYNGQQKKDTDSKHFVFEIERTEYISETLDVAVVKLKREIHKDFPPPLEFFDILDPEKNDNEHIYLIGHDKGGELQTNYGIGLWNPTEKRLNDLEKFCQDYGKENGYKELGKKNRLVIQCKFVSGASGCPGVVIHGDKASVVLIYTRGFPDFYYSKNFPEKDKQEFPKARLLQQGVNIGPVFKSMTKNKIYFNLRNEIFPHQASEEQQQLNGQHQYAVDGANKSINTTNPESTFKIVNDLEDHITVRREIENNTAKWTSCTEGHSEKAIPDSAKYNRQPSYALAIDNRVDIAYPNMKPPVDDTDITLPHGHSQNIPVHRNEQNITQETNLDVNKDSQSQLENASSEILDMVPEEKLAPYSNPGKTQPVKDITIENSVKHHQIRIRCDQGIPIKTIKDGMKLRLHSEGQLQTLTKPTGSWVSKLVICCDGRMVNIDSSCKSTSISTDNINLLKIKKDSSNYLQALLGNTDKEFEILMTLSTLLKINRIKPEDWLVPVIKHQHQMACYMLLAYMNEPNTNKEDAITNALKMAIEKNDKNITNTLCWFIIREYFKCVSFQIDGLLDVWPAMVCKKLNCHEFDQCSKDVVVVVEMVKSAKYLPKQFWNIPIEYLSQNDVIQIETKHSSKNTNVDVSIHDCFPEKFEIDGNLASNLFEKHSKLTFICKSIYTSKDCVKVYHPCVQLFCRRKGLIPIKENHFPKFINNVKTNILEGEPVFASRIRAGEQIKSTYYTGTLGGFVKIMGDITFITCAHVVVNKDVISGRKLSIPNTESTHIECVQLSPNSIDTFRCGKLRYIEFKTDRPGETSIDAALIALSEGIGIDNDDFIANRRSNKHSLKLLGLKSPFLNENCLDYEKMFYGKHFSQFHNVTIGAISSISVNGSKIVVPEDKDDGIHVDLETIVDTFKRVMQSENQQNVQSSMFSSAAPVFSNNAHTQETRLLKLDKERTYRRLSRSMYNQIAVTHIPFKPGDSGTCVYVCDNSLGAYGCMGMAIANHPGPDGGVILTPMKEILKTFHVDIQ